MTGRVFIDSFEAVPRVKEKTTYEEFRASVLRAGRFSVFEATDNQRTATMYDRLCRDPWIETDNSCGFPWTMVRLRDTPTAQPVEIFRCMVCKCEFGMQEGMRSSGPTCGHRHMLYVRDEAGAPTESRPAARPLVEPKEDQNAQ